MLNEALRNNLSPEETAKYCLEGKPQDALYQALQKIEEVSKGNQEATESLLDKIDDLSSRLQQLLVIAEDDTERELTEMNQDLTEIRSDLVQLRLR
ncbi:hypothetical protein [Endozoicomonas ascidiicola]|uniref:hypothetical protein n=1 Tax=Endozoicomonas ascidiicola TaxID=1698521 RepID=UPI00082AAADF|nr:hypothetical protein [Endozoicomonas ascidiicola]